MKRIRPLSCWQQWLNKSLSTEGSSRIRDGATASTIHSTPAATRPHAKQKPPGTNPRAGLTAADGRSRPVYPLCLRIWEGATLRAPDRILHDAGGHIRQLLLT